MYAPIPVVNRACLILLFLCALGIQDVSIYIDENGDAEGNYVVLARQPFTSLHSNYSVLPVGNFSLEENATMPVTRRYTFIGHFIASNKVNATSE